MKHLGNVNTGKHYHEKPENPTVGDLIQCECGWHLLFVYSIYSGEQYWREISRRRARRYLRKRAKRTV